MPPRLLPQNRVGTLTLIGSDIPSVVFDAVYLPFTAARTGGDAQFQSFNRWQRAPVRIYTGRQLWRYTLSGQYESPDWDNGTPFNQLRQDMTQGKPFELLVSYNRPTRDIQPISEGGLLPSPTEIISPPPFDIGQNPVTEVTINSLTETPSTATYAFGVPLVVSWNMELEEYAR